jgi:hypothetical protein
MNASASKAEVKAYGLVRNAEGKPQFADINNIPDPFWNMLTDEEKQEVKNDRIALSSNA